MKRLPWDYWNFKRNFILNMNDFTDFRFRDRDLYFTDLRFRYRDLYSLDENFPGCFGLRSRRLYYLGNVLKAPLRSLREIP